MASDGHTGISNKELKEEIIKQYSLVLKFAALKTADSSTKFIIHAHSSRISMSGAQVHDLLHHLGYRHFPGECVFHRNSCFWLPFAELRGGGQDAFEVEKIHQAFQSHVKNLPELLINFENIYRKLGVDRARKLDLFSELRSPSTPVLEATGEGLPSWASELMPEEYKNLQTNISNQQEKFKHLTKIGNLLTATGNVLEDAVCAAFKDLSFSASPTNKGETYDVIVQIEPGRNLLIEVTGIEGSLKKKSNKISQALDVFQNLKGENDQIIIAVNCFRELPLEERELDQFVTDDAMKLLTSIGVTVLPTQVLFDIWKTGRDDAATGQKLVKLLNKNESGLFMMPEVVSD